VIPYGKQSITQEDIDAVVSVMQSPLIAQGPEVELFEGAVASYVGCSDAIAVNSATSALHISCLALDLGPGDVLWTSPISFVASANCARTDASQGGRTRAPCRRAAS
jgi:dTDP-4-amino-4,6-dideoxygalactose transaminase